MTNRVLNIRVLTLFFAIFVGLLIERIAFVSNLDQPGIVAMTPDDAFYYFKTASNITHHLGSTFDGINPTNGYHPLWMLALCLLFPVLPQNPLILAKAALITGLIFHFLAGAVIFLILRTLTQKNWPGVIGSGLYLFNTQAMISSVNGLETCLSGFIFACCIFFFLITFTRAGFTFSSRACYLAGLLLGSLLLARTDNIFYVAAFFLTMFIAGKERGMTASKWIVVLAGFVSISLPWFAWNFFRFGTIVQSSGLAVPFMAKSNYLIQGHSHAEMIQNSFGFLGGVIKRGIFEYIGWDASHSYRYYGLVFLSFLMLALQNKRTPQEKPWFFFKTVFLLFLGSAALIFVHAFVRWSPRSWYFHQQIILNSLLFSAGLSLAEPGMILKASTGLSPGRNIARGLKILDCAFLLGLALWLTPLGFHTYGATRDYLMHGPYNWQAEEMNKGISWIKNNTREDDVIASFNSGIYGYFSGRKVVNLDGVINSEAYEALKARKLADLLFSNRVSYLIDYSMSFVAYQYYFELPYEKFTKKRASLAGPENPILIYKIQKPI